MLSIRCKWLSTSCFALFPCTTIFRSVSWHADSGRDRCGPGFWQCRLGRGAAAHERRLQGCRDHGQDRWLSQPERDRKSTRLNSSHEWTAYAVFCLKKKKLTTVEQVYY